MAFDSAAEARGLFERVKLRLPSGDLESRSPIDGRVSDILAGPSGVHLLPKRRLPEVRRQPHDRRAYFPDSIAS